MDGALAKDTSTKAKDQAKEQKEQLKEQANNNKKAKSAKPLSKASRAKRKRVRTIVLSAIALVVAAVVVSSILNQPVPLPVVRYTTLELGTLAESVSAKGAVVSTVRDDVYSPLAYAVRSVSVDVGDEVAAGQELCRLDATELESALAQKQAALRAAESESQKAIDEAERQVEQAKSDLEGAGVDAQLVSAQAQIDASAASLSGAKANYNKLSAMASDGTSASLTSASAAVANAKMAMEQSEAALAQNQELLAAGAVAQADVDRAQTAYDNAVAAYDSALASLKSAKESENLALIQAKSAVDTAQTSYSSALESLAALQEQEAAQRAQRERALATAEANLAAAQKPSSGIESLRLEIADIQSQIERTVVRASESGVVTQRNATVGAPGSGLLFVVEGLQGLEIKTDIKEYDIGKLAVGMPVVITSDSVEGAEYKGAVKAIAPTATKGANASGAGATTSGDVLFAVDVRIDDADPRLKIGMNTSLKIITEQKDDVFSVPSGAVTQDAEGNDIIYVIETVDAPDGAGTAESESAGVGTAEADTTEAAQTGISIKIGAEAVGPSDVLRAIPVTTGLETAFNIEVAAEGLTPGMRVVSDPNAEGVADGAAVSVEVS